MGEAVKAMPNIRQAVVDMEHYINTYSSQPGYEQYTEKTFIDDMLYGIGIAISGEYKTASGFDKLKQKLIEHLSK